MPRSGRSRAALPLLRLAYRAAYRVLQVRALLVGRTGRGVKCLLTDEEGRMLLVRHTYGDRRVWHVPGGGVHRGETLAQAAQREMGEELGVTGMTLRPLATVTVQSGCRRTSVPCLQSHLKSSTPIRADPVEILAVGWFSPAALPAGAGDDARQLAALELAPSAGQNASDNEERMP